MKPRIHLFTPNKNENDRLLKSLTRVKKKRLIKQKLINDAVEWCTVNNKRGQAALNSGLFPGTGSKHTINKKTGWKIVTWKREGIYILSMFDLRSTRCPSALHQE